jgi:hypothetical protein
MKRNADDQPGRMAFDHAAHAGRGRFPFRPTLEQRLAVAAADEEADLVAEGPADERDEDDDRV